MSILYETDFYAWTIQQAALLRTGRLSDADIDQIAEEIESMGRSERRELVNRLAVLLAHLLKWRFQSDRRSRSWRLTIKEQRIRLARQLGDNPSLRAQFEDAATDAYGLAVVRAERETGLDASDFPKTCPFSFAEVTDDAFFPDGGGLY